MIEFQSKHFQYCQQIYSLFFLSTIDKRGLFMIVTGNIHRLFLYTKMCLNIGSSFRINKECFWLEIKCLGECCYRENYRGTSEIVGRLMNITKGKEKLSRFSYGFLRATVAATGQTWMQSILKCMPSVFSREQKNKNKEQVKNLLFQKEKVCQPVIHFLSLICFDTFFLENWNLNFNSSCLITLSELLRDFHAGFVHKWQSFMKIVSTFYDVQSMQTQT